MTLHWNIRGWNLAVSKEQSSKEIHLLLSDHTPNNSSLLGLFSAEAIKILVHTPDSSYTIEQHQYALDLLVDIILDCENSWCAKPDLMKFKSPCAITRCTSCSTTVSEGLSQRCEVLSHRCKILV
jgi:hypothetical protein